MSSSDLMSKGFAKCMVFLRAPPFRIRTRKEAKVPESPGLSTLTARVFCSHKLVWLLNVLHPKSLHPQQQFKTQPGAAEQGRACLSGEIQPLSPYTPRFLPALEYPTPGHLVLNVPYLECSWEGAGCAPPFWGRAR